MTYLLLKSEPDVYGIDHLRADKRTIWDGVRNYQARNHMLSASVGDLALFYHSNAKPPGVAGVCKVTKVGVVDPTQFDPASHYYDATSKPSDPRWLTIEVRFVAAFKHFVTLDELRQHFTPDELWILRRGNRLSVTPVDDAVAERIIERGRRRSSVAPPR
jgi:predicted RNA-binding protein with PUA-like domain